MRHALRSAPSAPCRVEKPYIITTFKSLRLLFSWTVFLWLLFLQLHDPLSGIPFVILGILTVTNCGDYYFSLTSHACCLSCSSPSSREAWTGGTPPLAPTISSSSWIPCFISVARCESWGRISILQTFYPQKQPNTSDQVTVMLAVWSWCKISVHRERFSFIRLQVIQQLVHLNFGFCMLMVLSQILLHHEEETGKQQPATLTFYTFSMGLASIWSLSPFSPLFLSHALRLINTCKVKWHAGSGQ